MKYVVKIDPDSIVRNKNAGKTETNIFLGSNEVVVDGKAKNVDIYRSVAHPPIPEFTFTHMVTEIKCKKCKKPSEISDLGAVSHYDEKTQALTSSETVCPHCDTWDCCELEFQELEDLEPMKVAQ